MTFRPSQILMYTVVAAVVGIIGADAMQTNNINLPALFASRSATPAKKLPASAKTSVRPTSSTVPTETADIGTSPTKIITKTTAPSPTPFRIANHAKAQQVVNLVNAERVKRGLGALVVNPQLTQAATLRAAEMIDNNYFAHESPAGSREFIRLLNKAGYAYDVAGENLSTNFEPLGAVQAWLNSPSHKKNMLLSTFTETGVAYVDVFHNSEFTIMTVQLFGLPK